MNNQKDLDLQTTKLVKYLPFDGAKHPFVDKGSIGVIVNESPISDQNYVLVKFKDSTWTMNIKDLRKVEDPDTLYIKDQIKKLMADWIEDNPRSEEDMIEHFSLMTIDLMIKEFTRMRTLVSGRDNLTKIDSRINYFKNIIKK
jgi:hypothetical protein